MNGLLMWKAREDSEADSIRFDAQGLQTGSRRWLSWLSGFLTAD
jgi:hypothetical protein